jgi:hypothetical protein
MFVGPMNCHFRLLKGDASFIEISCWCRAALSFDESWGFFTCEVDSLGKIKRVKVAAMNPLRRFCGSFIKDVLISLQSLLNCAG